MQITKPTQLTLEGRGIITVRPSDHVATGGEGSVFKIANTILKIYTDPSKMVADDMPSKVRALSALSHPGILAPKGIITDRSPIGFYMDYAEGTPLTPFFSNDFRNQNGIDAAKTLKIAQAMQEIYAFAHVNKAILVDANELNWIVAPDLSPKAIDVDSWAISKWPAKVIMPSIRDWHSKTFNELTDWFSWGIVTFQLFTGIHPYKGTLQGFARGAMVDRMKANASVFSSGIKLNNAVRDFRTIPEPLRIWYKETFQDGRRSLPPLSLQGVVSVPKVQKVIKSSQRLTHKLIYDGIKDPIIKLFYCGLALTQSYKIIQVTTGKIILNALGKNTEAISVNNGWLIVSEGVFTWINGTSLERIPVSMSSSFSSVIAYKNRMFIVSEQGLSELSLMIFNKPILSTVSTWATMPNSTRWFSGCGIADMIGATYLLLPFANSSCANVRVKELDGLTPVSAYLGDHFFSCITVNKAGDYIKSEFSFDSDYRDYVYWEGRSDLPVLNTATLQKGICSTITEDGVLNLFAYKSPGQVMKIDDPSMEMDMQLFNMNEEIYYLKDGSVYSLKTT
jgi:Protein tyrosine and serine/threonine kinase